VLCYAYIARLGFSLVKDQLRDSVTPGDKYPDGRIHYVDCMFMYMNSN
jgi:hypothetical protein